MFRLFFFYVMIRRPPRSTRTDTLFPYTTLFRSFIAFDALIRNGDGSVAFSLPGVVVPTNWSETARNIMAQKYFRRAGVPDRLERIPEDGVPAWLWRSRPAACAKFTGETDCLQVFDGLAGCWAYWAWQGGYYASEGDRKSKRLNHRHKCTTS